MNRIWSENGKYFPKADVEHWLEADWHFPPIAMLFNTNFVWYHVEERLTLACVKKVR